ncbi:hypothetical protein PENTCL1PPCAC_29030 [Pristionchus entomophagus]|uniref:Piwi domain-containing protein n=1 Tax=Pristionchus entomophagus TaxID=358040 RepID=A0AAV5UIL4_9BILA|nr:hypothetical protein PENTCL1PPCAC_29030 [Pristionchus entomophagus]
MSTSTIEKKMQELSTAEGHVMPKLAGGTKGRAIDVISNLYPAHFKKHLAFFLYAVDIIAEFDRADGESKRKEITKRTKDDFLEQERKKVATMVFMKICEKKELPGACAYDRASLLISLQKLTKADEGEWIIVLEKDSSPLFKENSIQEANRLIVTIKKAADTYQVTSDDLMRQKLEQLQALMNVVAIATSQNVFKRYNDFVVYKSGVFLMDPAALSLPELPCGSDEKYIGQGFSKGVDIVGAHGKENTMAMILDAKKTAFHYDLQLLSEKMKMMSIENHIVLLNRQLKRLRAIVHYPGSFKKGDRERSVQIDGFGCPVRETVLDINGRKIKLADFVLQKYNTKLKDLSLPCVITKSGTFSPETLLIAPNQRVRVDQMQKAVQEAIIKASASKPSDRKAEITKLRGTIIAPKEMGVEVDAAPMKAPARILGSPSIGTGQGEVRPRNGTWLVKRFVRGAACEKWTLAFIRSQGDRVDLRKAADAIVRKATELGMYLGHPMLVEEQANRRDVDSQTAELVRKAKLAGSQFIMMVTYSRIENHDALKKAELEYDIVTQQLKSETAGVLHMKAATLSNVLKKTNEKLGGVNLTVNSKDLPRWLLARDTLVCGMTIDQPRPQMKDEIENKAQPDRPAIIAWGSNAVKGGGNGETEAVHFSGGYSYAYPRESKIVPAQETTKKDVIRRIVESFKACRGLLPATVLLIRRINEGDSKMVLAEVDEWKEIFSSMGVSPKMVVVTANLNHASRVFNPNMDVRARAMEQNLEAGLAVDSVITSPTQNEFLLQAHVPRQGTARPTKYNILYCDEGLKISMDSIECAMFALCHTHGVCDMTTALPTPLKISEECCKRALNLFHHAAGKRWVIEDLNKDLAVQQNTPLDMLRTNA